MAMAEPKLAVAAHRGRPVVVDVSEEVAARVAEEAGAFALDAPVIGGLEEGLDPVLLGELEPGVVHPGEGEGALVAGLEVGVRRVEVRRAQIQICPASRTPINDVAHRQPHTLKQPRD